MDKKNVEDEAPAKCPFHFGSESMGTYEVQPKDTSRRHFYVSLVKSVFRIGAGTSLIMVGLPEAGWFFIVAEVLGIVEELV